MGLRDASASKNNTIQYFHNHTHLLSLPLFRNHFTKVFQCCLISNLNFVLPIDMPLHLLQLLWAEKALQLATRSEFCPEMTFSILEDKLLRFFWFWHIIWPPSLKIMPIWALCCCCFNVWPRVCPFLSSLWTWVNLQQKMKSHIHKRQHTLHVLICLTEEETLFSSLERFLIEPTC